MLGYGWNGRGKCEEDEGWKWKMAKAYRLKDGEKWGWECRRKGNVRGQNGKQDRICVCIDLVLYTPLIDSS